MTEQHVLSDMWAKLLAPQVFGLALNGMMPPEANTTAHIKERGILLVSFVSILLFPPLLSSPSPFLLLPSQTFLLGRSRFATAASFIRPTRPIEAPVSFIAALRDKYTAELPNAAVIQFSGKIAEEVGFEKTRSKQAQLSELRYAVLDGSRIATVYEEGDPSIADTCPRVVELDLSRNLFKRIGPVVAICSELPRLRELRLK